MSQSYRIVHYLNQFFGGIGGEEKASVGCQSKDGPVGPGKGIQLALQGRGEVVGTVICGDNYFADKTGEAVQEILPMIAAYRPEVLIAGPAFNAGRYGVACGEICKAVQEKMGIAAVTAMYKDNPGVDLYKQDLYIVETADSATGMKDAIAKMVKIALKLVKKQRIGKPINEGYFNRGIIMNEFAEQNAAERAVSMVLSKIKGEPFESEIELPKFDKVKPAPAVKAIASAKIGLTTDGGLVPKGNPDDLEHRGATKFGTYSIKGQNTLSGRDYEGHHIGYDTTYIQEDPNRLVPVDIMRELEQEKIIGELNDRFYSLAGVGTAPEKSKTLGQAIAGKLKADGVVAAIHTST